MQQTLAIIKPDGIKKEYIGKIITMLEHHKMTIRHMKMMYLTSSEAESFYEMHASKPFFNELVRYMTEGPIVVMVLEGENIIEKYRSLMGATDPKQAIPGTIRNLYGVDLSANCVHGSDSLASAQREVRFFFEG